MTDKPAAEVTVDEGLARRLLGQAPRFASLPLAFAAEGWDCSVWRLGDRLALRIPRRAIAAQLVRNEQSVLPAIAERLRSTGVGVPVSLFDGSPDAGFPWPWSIVPGFESERGIDVPRTVRRGWAEPLAAALSALHVPAAAGYPVNPFRGVALAERDASTAARLLDLRGRDPAAAGGVDAATLDALAALWQRGMAATTWTAAPVWIHGDLHPGNLIARGETLTAIIDFGDVTAGDPAYDLAIAWLAFDPVGRELFRSALWGRYDRATWVRARAWAAADTLVFLSHSDDDPHYEAFGRDAAAAVIADDPHTATDDS